MKYRVSCLDTGLNGYIGLPSSKSISNRVLIMNALCGEPVAVENLSNSDDTRVLVDALRFEGNEFDIGAAGTAMRFLTAFLAGRDGEWTVTGSDRMKKRPVGLLVDALRSIGARIEYVGDEGFPPLRIYGGKLKGGSVSVSGGVSSQFISALLMIAPATVEGLEIRLEGEVVSLPYIRLTVGLMGVYGVEVNWENNVLSVLPQDYVSVPFRVESDWSAASYWYSVAALVRASAFKLKGLYEDSLQGDSEVAALFGRLGVLTFCSSSGALIRHTGERCERMDYNFVYEPDLAQTFVVCCCLLGVPFRFDGLHTLRIKETDRITALVTEMRKLGYVLKDSSPGTLEWDGERCCPDEHPVIATYDDHRMAMSFAPAGAVLDGGVVISDPDVVSKSYPYFWNDLFDMGFDIEEA